MSHPDAPASGSGIEKFSDQGKGQKQHVRNLLFKNKDNLPNHIKHMFDEVTATPGKWKDRFINKLFEKRNGKGEMNLVAMVASTKAMYEEGVKVLGKLQGFESMGSSRHQIRLMKKLEDAIAKYGSSLV